LHPCVDLPDDSCTRLPEGGDGGPVGDVHYVVVEQDLDQSIEGPKANLASEGKPRIINPVFKIMQLSLLCLCIYVCAFAMIPRYLCSLLVC
jgi:hypothetical protein